MQQPGEAEGSLTSEARGRVGAALTTTRRAGTARRLGLGKQGGTVYARNQRQSPLSAWPIPKPGGHGLVSSACPLHVGNSDVGLDPSIRRPRGKPAAYPWRSCRGIVGHRPHRSVNGERGNHPGAPLHVPDLGGWGESPLSADGVRMGRSPRSSPRSGKPATWRRRAAVPQSRNGRSGGRW